MPQLIPFFFLTQIFWGFATIFAIIFVTSKYVLPRILSLHLARLFIVKLNK